MMMMLTALCASPTHFRTYRVISGIQYGCGQHAGIHTWTLKAAVRTTTFGGWFSKIERAAAGRSLILRRRSRRPFSYHATDYLPVTVH